MRENRPYGSEGGEAKAFPTPITCGALSQHKWVGALGYSGALSSLGRRRMRLGQLWSGLDGKNSVISFSFRRPESFSAADTPPAQLPRRRPAQADE